MGATPSPPPTSTTVPSSLRIWLGRPHGPMKSRIGSTPRKVIISKVVLPTAWITTVTVPRSTLKSATVNGIRSPCSSMRAMMKCPGRAARATSGALTSQRKVDGPNCFLRVMRNTTPPEGNTIAALKSTIPDGLKLGVGPRWDRPSFSWPVRLLQARRLTGDKNRSSVPLALRFEHPTKAFCASGHGRDETDASASGNAVAYNKSYGRKENSHYGRRPSGRRQPELADGGPPRAGPHPGLPALRKDGAFQPRADSRTRSSRQGNGRLRRLYRDRRHHPLYHRQSLQ